MSGGEIRAHVQKSEPETLNKSGDKDWDSKEYLKNWKLKFSKYKARNGWSGLYFPVVLFCWLPVLAV
jgi:hypothetical protein